MKIFVIEKSIGIGFGKFCYRKSIGFGIENFWYRKKVSVSFRFLVSSFTDTTEYFQIQIKRIPFTYFLLLLSSLEFSSLLFFFFMSNVCMGSMFNKVFWVDCWIISQSIFLSLPPAWNNSSLQYWNSQIFQHYVWSSCWSRCDMKMIFLIGGERNRKQEFAFRFRQCRYRISGRKKTEKL